MNLCDHNFEFKSQALHRGPGPPSRRASRPRSRIILNSYGHNFEFKSQALHRGPGPPPQRALRPGVQDAHPPTVNRPDGPYRSWWRWPGSGSGRTRRRGSPRRRRGGGTGCTRCSSCRTPRTRSRRCCGRPTSRPELPSRAASGQAPRGGGLQRHCVPLDAYLGWRRSSWCTWSHMGWYQCHLGAWPCPLHPPGSTAPLGV